MSVLNSSISELVRTGSVDLVSENAADTYSLIDRFLAKHGDSAFYIVNLSHIVKQVELWKALFPNVQPFYAVKCNSDRVILKVLAELGVNFDCASKNEIKNALDFVGPDRIIYANPCKTSQNISYSRSQDVDLLVFDSQEELYKIKIYHPYAKLVLRIKVDDTLSLCRFSQKFGMGLDDVPDIIDLCKLLKLNVVGVSFHVGSGCGSGAQFAAAVQDAAKVFDMFAQKSVYLSLLDIGGGFVDRPDFAAFIQPLVDALGDFQRSYPSTTMIAEPGRFFVAQSHTLVLQVIGKKVIKHSDDVKFAYYLNDGIYGSFNCAIFDHARPEICPYSERNEDTKHPSWVFGPTCDSVDKMDGIHMLPELVISETVFVPNFGAYTRASSTTFNGFDHVPSYYVIVA